jgi:hypothetical protein
MLIDGVDWRAPERQWQPAGARKSLRRIYPTGIFGE